MNTGMSTDKVKQILTELQNRIRTHDLAVIDVRAKHGTSPLVQNYVAEWETFKKKVDAAQESADAWTGYYLEAEANARDTEFALLLTKFSALGPKLTLEKGDKKIELLQEIVDEQNGVGPPVRTSHVVNVKSDAMASPTALLPPGSGFPALDAAFPGLQQFGPLIKQVATGVGILFGGLSVYRIVKAVTGG